MRQEVITPPVKSTDPAIANLPRPSRLIRLPEVIARVGMSRSAIYKRMTEGRFPKSRSLGPKCAVWLEGEIDAWIDEISHGISR